MDEKTFFSLQKLTAEELKLLAEIETFSIQAQQYLLQFQEEQKGQTQIDPEMQQSDASEEATCFHSYTSEDFLHIREKNLSLIEKLQEISKKLDENSEKEKQLVSLLEAQNKNQVLTPNDTLTAVLSRALKEGLPTFDGGFELANDTLPDTLSKAPSSSSSSNYSTIMKDRYDILETLGEGGMGTVQRVLDRLLGREVALKRIRVDSGETRRLNRKQQMMVWRLKREASLTSRLEHPNIVPLYDMQRKSNGEMYFTMRKIEGETLGELLRKKREKEVELEENKRLSIFLKICDAVSYAHNHEVVHRDLKPDNIMIGEFGEVYVMDWGIAKKIGESGGLAVALEDEKDYRTRGGIGTLGYMAPEQELDASLVTPQADIYSLGRILRECYIFLSPREEFKRRLEFDAQVRKTQKKGVPSTETLVPLESVLPLDIKAIIEKATAEKAEKRYLTVSELAKDIEHYLSHNRVSARKYTFIESAYKWLQRNRQVVLVGSLVLFLCIAFPLYYQQEKEKEQQTLLKENRYKRLVRFKITYQSAKREKEKALNLVATDAQEIATKIEYLLNSLHLLNIARTLQPKNENIQKEKLVIGKELLPLCYKTQDYQLARYVAKEMKEVSLLSIAERELLLEEVEQERTKILRANLLRFSKWKEKLLQNVIDKTEQEDLLFEISKMREPEILQELLNILEKGLQQFLQEKLKQRKEKEYYILFVKALGRLENPKAGPFLLQGLKKMASKYAKVSKNELDEAVLDYMVALTQALKNSKALDTAADVWEIRWSMGQNGNFWKRTENVYLALIERDKLQYQKPQNTKEFIESGLRKYDQKNYQGALADFNAAIFQEPQNGDAYNNRGLVYTELKDWNKALADFNKVIELNPRDSIAYNNRGTAKKACQDYQGALLDFTQAIELNPNYSDVYVNRATTKKFLKDYKGALDDFTKAITLNPKNITAYNNRGIVKQIQGDYDGAIEDYTKSIQLHPQDALAYNNRGSAKKAKKDLSGAIKDFTKAISLNPNHSLAFSNRGSTKILLKHFKDGLEDLNEALRLEPKNSNYYLIRGPIFERLNRWEEALEDYSLAISLSPKSYIAHYYRGLLLSRLGKLTEALEDFNRALEAEPKNSEIFYHRGTLFYLQKDLDKAIADYLNAIQLNPKNSRAFYNLGVSYYQKKNWEKAIAHLNQAIKLNSQYSEAYYTRAVVLFIKKEIELSTADYTKVLELKPDHSGAFYNRANNRLIQGDLKGAIEDYSAVIRINPDYAVAYRNRANVKYEQGDLKGAIEDYSLSIQKDPKDAKSYHERGYTIAELKKDFELAIADYNEALRLNPKFADAYYNRGNAKYSLKDLVGAKLDFQLYLKLIEGMSDNYLQQTRQKIGEKFPELVR